MERGHLHFGLFTIIVGALFAFMLGGPISESGLAISNNVSVDNNIQTPDYDSFCVKYSDDDRERDNHEYDGHCQVYFNDVISVSGAVVGIEYLGENSVKYNINSKDFKSVKEGEEISYRLKSGETFTLSVNEVLYSSKGNLKDSTTFDYTLSGDKSGSFCEGSFCTIYLGDKLKVKDHEIELIEFSMDEDKLTVEVDSKEYKESNLKRGSVRKFEDLVVSFEEFNEKENYTKFKHNCAVNAGICNDTDQGKDYFNQGIVNGFFENNDFVYGEDAVRPVIFTDYCYELTPTLIEFYCDRNDYLVAESHLCPGGCLNGACMEFNGTVNQSEESEIVIKDSIETDSVNEQSEQSKEIVNNQENVVIKNVSMKKKKSFFERILAWFGF